MIAYSLSVAALIGIYVILATSYDLLMGYTGMFSIAHGAFYGIGAYAGALGELRWHLTFLPALALSFAVTAGFAIVVGWPATRLTGDYLIVASLGFAFIVNALMLNLAITRGTQGLPGIPLPDMFGTTVSSAWGRTGLIWVVSAICCFFLWRLAHSPFGRVLVSIRDDPVAAAGSGKNVSAYKRTVFVLASAFAGLAGCLYATYIQFIDPNSFVIDTSFLILIAVILGGKGTFWGPTVGAAIIWILPESLRFFPLTPTTKGPLREIIYAALILVILSVRPQGVLGGMRSAVIRRQPVESFRNPSSHKPQLDPLDAGTPLP